MTRWNVRPTLASAFSACSKGTSRRSSVTGASWNCGSKMKFTPATRPRAWYTSRRLALRNERPSGSRASGPRARPGSARSRARSLTCCHRAGRGCRPAARASTSVSPAARPPRRGSGPGPAAAPPAPPCSRPRPASRRAARACSSAARSRARSRRRRYRRLSGASGRPGSTRAPRGPSPGALGLLARPGRRRTRAAGQPPRPAAAGRAPHPVDHLHARGTWKRNSPSEAQVLADVLEHEPALVALRRRAPRWRGCGRPRPRRGRRAPPRGRPSRREAAGAAGRRGAGSRPTVNSRAGSRRGPESSSAGMPR